ncbi:MAG: AMP-binding protein [Sandaracinaceae bacterium]|nr:AMP-binding protein [Sandaracinaceae bacterium]
MVSDALDLERAAREAGEREAWIDEAGALTFEALAGAAREAAARWPALSPGDRVLLTPRLDRESALALLACLDARATIVLAHPRWSEAERAAVARRTRPRLVLDGGARACGASPRTARAMLPVALCRGARAPSPSPPREREGRPWGNASSPIPARPR